MDNFQIWIIAGILISLFEIITPGSFISVCFGVAAVITGIITSFDISLNTQIILFAILSAINFIGLRPLIIKYLHSNTQETNTDAMIDKVYLVTETINNAEESGYIKCGSEYWKAKSRTLIFRKF